MRNKVFVVEGIHDVSKIKEVYKDAYCVITNGSEISNDTLNLIKELSKENEIVIFTDPDYPGERIRKKIQEIVPNASNAFILKEKSISKNKKKVGVEHATKSDIKKSLDNIYQKNEISSDITFNDLYELGLVGKVNSKELRDKVSNKLNMGRPNAKTFLLRCKMFGYNKDKIKEVIDSE